MAKGAGTALTRWDQQLLADANLARAQEESVMLGSFLSLRGGVLSFNGNPFPGNKVNAIVLDSVLENVFYGAKFDPDSPASPKCYAFGRDNDGMAPHEKAPDKQHATCKGCPQNEWESGDRGRGKACKNSRRLAVILADEALKSAATLKDAQLAFLRVPVTSVKAWAGYVTQLANVAKKPTYAVVTELALTPDPKTQFKLSFKLAANITNGALYDELIAKRKAAMEGIIFPYAVREDGGDGGAARGGGRGRKFVRKG